VPWDDFPPAKAWYERIKCRPAFRGLLADRLPGMAPANGYQDLDF
jgi:glutathione S-transferase